MRRFFVHLALLLTTFTAVAQPSDSIRTLRQAEVRDVRKAPLDYGKSIQILKNNLLQNDLGSLLQGNSSVVIKSYGPGMLSSISIRGTGAAHSPILWNGLNIQNNMNGQQDLSLIQGFLFDNITLNAGAQNNLSTGGILGGSIQLGQQKITKDFQILAGMDYGSFNTQRYRLGLDLRNKRWSNCLRFISQKAENDFSYQDRSVVGNPEKQMQHSQTESMAVLDELRFFINRRWQAGISVWYQNAQRNIPPTLISPSDASQEDAALRFNAFVEYSDSLNYFQVNSGVFLEHLWYHDPAKKLEGLNHSTRFVNQVQYRRKIREIALQFGASYLEDHAGSNSYTSEEVVINTGAIYAAAYGNPLRAKRLFWKADIRQEFRKNQIPEPAFSLGMDYLITSKNTFRLHISHISRLPNLNDLYWNPGGNPDLKPEKGYGSELSYLFQTHTKEQLLKLRFTAFYSIIDQWIIWLPDNGYWTPQNLQKVHNRGAEWELKTIRHIQKHQFQFVYGGGFTLASNEKAKNQQDQSLGKQLIYVPYWKNYLQVNWEWKTVQVTYRHSFTGGRYTSTDNISYLAPYSTGDVEITWSQKIKQLPVQLSLGIQNIGNTSYESIEWRPMPGRYFQVSLDINLSLKKKNKITPS